MKFRKKPIIVTAVQFNIADVKTLRKAVMTEPLEVQLDLFHFFKEKYGVRCTADGCSFWIETLEGNMKVKAGDFIVTGIKGERYPVKKDIFKATYEEIDSTQ